MMALGAALALETGCGKPSEGAPAGKGGGKAGRGALEFPVEVEAVEARDVEYVVSAVGSVEAFEQVQITARVAGVVERVRFMEGQSVKQGQGLAGGGPGGGGEGGEAGPVAPGEAGRRRGLGGRGGGGHERGEGGGGAGGAQP